MSDTTLVAVVRDIRKAMCVPRERMPREWHVNEATFAKLTVEIEALRAKQGLPVWSAPGERPNILLLGIPVFAR